MDYDHHHVEVHATSGVDQATARLCASRCTMTPGSVPYQIAHGSACASRPGPSRLLSARAFLAELSIEYTLSERPVRRCCLTALWNSLQPDGASGPCSFNSTAVVVHATTPLCRQIGDLST